MSRTLLFFCTEDWFVCSHWLPHLAAARDAGYTVHVATRVREHGDRIAALGVNLVPLTLSRRSRHPWTEARSFLEVLRVYRRLRPDLVVHIALKPVVHGGLAARWLGIRGVVNYVAGLGWIFTSASPQARLLRPILAGLLGWILRRGRVIVENFDNHARLVALGVPAAQITRVPGAGVDMREFAPVPAPDGDPLVVMAARMLWAKGVGEFVAAAQSLKSQGIRARFALVGMPDGENPSSVPLAQLEQWRNAGIVEWWGHRGDMPRVFAESHIVCLPSAYGEGVPKVLIEAAAAGRPIVTTDTPGCREIVRADDNGLLVPVQDAAALAEALRRLIADPALRERMGMRSREIAMAEFSVERVKAATLEIYAAALR